MTLGNLLPPETFSLPCVTWGSVEPSVQVSVKTKHDAALLGMGLTEKGPDGGLHVIGVLRT